ncbi:MAG: ImmA/IrrE family metallo-endopeptidase [Bacteroidales bacterium]
MSPLVQKQDVINQVQFLNPIGLELKEIFEANEIPLTTLSEFAVDYSNLEKVSKLNKNTLKKIAAKITIPDLYDYFILFQENYAENKNKADAEYKLLKKKYNEIKQIYPLLQGEFNDGIDKFEDLSNFLNISDEKKILEEVNTSVAMYRIANFSPNSLNLYAWLRRGELDFAKFSGLRYNKEALLEWINQKEYMSRLSDVDYFLSLPNKLREYGVALVYTPYLEKTVCGAVRWIRCVPLVQISDRGKNLIGAWHTLLHELGHVVLHEGDEVFDDEGLSLSKANISKKEKQANDFSYQYLFNGDELRRHIFAFRNKAVSSDFTEKTAKEFAVPESVVAYWAQKAQLKKCPLKCHIPSIKF